jgi:exodeoxyribonuclease VII large subunit
MDREIFTVSSLTREIKELLEISFPKIWVEGEISNLKLHSSGHLYFTLKDEAAQISCAMWRFQANRLLFRPQDGMQILLEGELQVYEKGGRYQLIVTQMQPAGVGALQLAFEQLKKKLHSEGLFDEQYKKPIPTYPEKIGVITSPTGAAILDIISVARRRYPGIHIIVNPVRVMGDGAAEEIAQAIRDFNKFAKIDVLIIGRGGGSLEDLWAFNDEVVARAIFESKLPVVSAVGHEIDYSIADFVADYRAPTPSAAAELVVKDRKEMQGIVGYYCEKIADTFSNTVNLKKERLNSIRQSYAFRKPADYVYQKFLRLDEIQRSITIAMQHNLKLKNQILDSLVQKLYVLNPNSILNRGYSICFKAGKVVKDVAKLKIKDIVQIQLAKGKFSSQVKAVE